MTTYFSALVLFKIKTDHKSVSNEAPELWSFITETLQELMNNMQILFLVRNIFLSFSFENFDLKRKVGISLPLKWKHPFYRSIAWLNDNLQD